MNQFKNKVLYIESNEMLEEVRALIEEKGIKIDKEYFFLSGIEKRNYLYYCDFWNEFSISWKEKHETKITLEEFKELFEKVDYGNK